MGKGQAELPGLQCSGLFMGSWNTTILAWGTKGLPRAWTNVVPCNAVVNKGAFAEAVSVKPAEHSKDAKQQAAAIKPVMTR